MKTKVWGWVSIFATLFLWIWIIISMPSFRGLDSPEARDAKGVILTAFLILGTISIVSGVLLVRKRN
jgi:hypothetical protein